MRNFRVVVEYFIGRDVIGTRRKVVKLAASSGELAITYALDQLELNGVKFSSVVGATAKEENLQCLPTRTTTG